MRFSPEQLAAELYDVSVPDWDGEMDFYRDFAHEARERGQPVLEIACGTGRVTLRLAQEGVNIVGVDIDEEMLKVARRKSEGVPNVGWVRGDMQSLDLNRMFGLVLIPGHSFQFMCSPEDQVKALETFKHHLEPGGTLIIHLDHQSVDWLGDLDGKFEYVSVISHLRTGQRMRKSNAWTYERSTQTARVITRWEELEDEGSVLQTWEQKTKALHCVFPFEMEHLLARAGYKKRIVYGDFFKHPLDENSPEDDLGGREFMK